MAQTPPPDMIQAAENAARQVQTQLLAMMMANEVGEVAVVLHFNQVQVEVRPVHKLKATKLERGRWAVIEKVTQP